MVSDAAIIVKIAGLVGVKGDGFAVTAVHDGRGDVEFVDDEVVSASGDAKIDLDRLVELYLDDRVGLITTIDKVVPSLTIDVEDNIGVRIWIAG